MAERFHGIRKARTHYPGDEGLKRSNTPLMEFLRFIHDLESAETDWFTLYAHSYARVTRLRSGRDGLMRDNGSGADTVAFPPLPLKASQFGVCLAVTEVEGTLSLKWISNRPFTALFFWHAIGYRSTRWRMNDIFIIAAHYGSPRLATPGIKTRARLGREKNLKRTVSA
ncbi:hypothetical protein DBV15_10549 [Temnothorax longispinosus]|uniref:Uncharacterized protein n=1 Tax=Temnothorax longispinosus TaxID=300112 RepID=A0A4S2L1I8_9HYME|nr:hypothetical protein DBV15_10549 [Temnothorax longispinosus]